jgi:hypothetical protein
MNPAIRVLTSCMGNWDGASAGKEQVLAKMAHQTDVISQSANADQSGVAPEITIGSVVIALPHTFLTVAREVCERCSSPRVLKLRRSTDLVHFAVSPRLANRIPSSQRTQVDSVRACARRWAPASAVANSVQGRQ